MPQHGYDGPGRVYGLGEIAQSYQKTIEDLEKLRQQGRSTGGFAKVLKVYSDRNTCDIRSANGALVHNVPVRVKGGVTASGEVWGTLDMPNEGDIVIVEMIGGMEHQSVITGTIYPYLSNEMQYGTPVNSNQKQFTKKLLEANKENYYRRIFKSGLTIEVQDDATVIVETPTGTFFKLNSDGTFEITDSYNNTIYSQSTSIIVNENLEVKRS